MWNSGGRHGVEGWVWPSSSALAGTKALTESEGPCIVLHRQGSPSCCMENRWGWARWRQRVIALNRLRVLGEPELGQGSGGAERLQGMGWRRCFRGRINTGKRSRGSPLPVQELRTWHVCLAPKVLFC